jgi:hypothetical protein
VKGIAAVVLASLVALPAGLAAGEKIEIRPLAQEHWNGSRTLRFKTPEGWLVQNTSDQVEVTEAWGDGMRLRLVRWPMDMGLDSTHSDCMLQRLAGPMQTSLDVRYEYDFVGGEIGERRALDSAFVVEYDKAIDGDKKWRQRNLTVVGAGESVCIITYVRNGMFKKSSAVKKFLTSLVEGVTFPPASDAPR